MLDAQFTKHRRDFTVNFSLKLHFGESIGLFGASGAGKSTVLACIAGIEEPDAGHIALGQVRFFPPSLPLHRRPVGYLTQEPSLFPHLAVGENVTFGVPKHDRSSDQAEWIATLRSRLRLEAFWDAPASRLSGGQARRVSLARMLARRPPLILLDEPFAGLDRQLVRELIDDLIFWSRNIGFGMIAVDHQSDVLRRLCPDRAVVLEHGQIVQEGSWTELYSAPATPLLGSLLAQL
ncbi:MAG: ABC transporter ATP-binding protein [Acidobacteriota bacterium]|nr:ABC transporter ATP-binding protein [Acidobacteriota bacterium]